MIQIYIVLFFPLSFFSIFFFSTSSSSLLFSNGKVFSMLVKKSCIVSIVIYLNAIQLAFERRKKYILNQLICLICIWDGSKCINENIQMRSLVFFGNDWNYMIHLHDQREWAMRRIEMPAANACHSIKSGTRYLIWPNWLMDEIL